jgi:hypothetical protein
MLPILLVCLPVVFWDVYFQSCNSWRTTSKTWLWGNAKKKQKQKRHIFEEMMKLKQLAWYWLQRLQVLPESPTWKRLTPRTEKDDASIHRACAYPSVCACIHVQCIYLATYLSPISRHVDKHDSKTLRGVSPVRLPVLEWAARAWFCSGIYCSLPGHIQILSFSGHTQIFI